MTALNKLTEKLYSYLLVGLVNTILCFMIMYLFSLLGFGYLTYTALGYIISILFGFFLSQRYTFSAEGKTTQRLCLFFCISLINLILVELIEHTLVESFSFNKILAILCGMSWYTGSGFLLNNFWVFRETNPIEAATP